MYYVKSVRILTPLKSIWTLIVESLQKLLRVTLDFECGTQILLEATLELLKVDIGFSESELVASKYNPLFFKMTFGEPVSKIGYK